MIGFPDEIKAFIHENYKGTPSKEMLKMIKDKFDFDCSYPKLKNYYFKNGLKIGCNCGQFNKETAPWNKGKRMAYNANSAKTQFKKGETPKSYRKLGSTRIAKDGYKEIKIADPNKWASIHRIVYEHHNGKIPKNHAVVFKNGDKLDVSIDNLLCVSRAELLRINQFGALNKPIELRDTAITMCKLKNAIYQKVRKDTENE